MYDDLVREIVWLDVLIAVKCTTTSTGLAVSYRSILYHTAIVLSGERIPLNFFVCFNYVHVYYVIVMIDLLIANSLGTIGGATGRCRYWDENDNTVHEGFCADPSLAAICEKRVPSRCLLSYVRRMIGSVQSTYRI